MDRPQLNILTGSTPSNLIHTLKDYVWDQGLMSRCILVYSADRPMIDIFNTPQKGKPTHLLHDLKMMYKLTGAFQHTKAFEKAVHDWKLLKLEPAPEHPKLRHYCSRRIAHLLKLSMIASVDRTNEMILDVVDFNTAFGWLIEVEETMPMIFQVGSVSPDSRVMDEVVHFMKQQGKGISEHLIVDFIRQQVPGYNVKNIMDTLIAARLIKVVGHNNLGLRIFTAP
jgi:hypothetical protein